MTLASTVTSKGQITIPAEMRRALDVRPGDRLLFEVTDRGATVTVLHRTSLTALAGSLQAERPAGDRESERRAVRTARGRRHARTTP